MSCDFNGQTNKDDELSLLFSDGMDWQSVATNTKSDITIYPVSGNHRSGSSQIKVKNIVDSSWEKTFHWGNLVATHYKGNYYAYALTIPGRAAGMVRVLRNDSNDRILLKGFQGFVRDLSFALHDHRILLGAVDEYGFILVHEIMGSSAELILEVKQLNPSSSEFRRIIWCPYVPENPLEPEDDVRNDSEDHALMFAVAHGRRVEIWHAGKVSGSVTYNNVTIGTSQIDEFDDAVVDLVFSPDSTAIAVASLDGHVRFFTVNTNKQVLNQLHKWQPHEGKNLSGIFFLDNLKHPNIRDCSLWKWALTSAENNTELKLWSCENWECHQTIRFQSHDSNPIFQKMTLDLSASFLLLTDIHRKVMYVMHIEQEEILQPDSIERTISKVTSITQILLPFSAISVAIREAALKDTLAGLEAADEYDAEDKPGQVLMKLLVVQPKSLQKCKAIFELGTSVPLGDGLAAASFSTLNTTSEYEASIVKPPAPNHFNLLTPDAFVSPAKVNPEETVHKQTLAPSPIPSSTITETDILALSSPRRPTPEVPSSNVTRRNGVQSGGSSPSREVEEILGTRPITETSVESPDTSSAVVPTGSALQDALAAYPASLSPGLVRSASANSKEVSPTGEKYEAPPESEPEISTYQAPTSTVVSSSTPITIPANGSLMDIFKEALSIDAAAQQSTMPTQAWPIAPVVPNHISQPPVRSKETSLDIDLSNQLTGMQQTLNQMLQLMNVQQAEQLKMKNEITQLRSEVNRLQSIQSSAGSQQGQQALSSQLETTLGVYFDRQFKKIDDISSPAKTQQLASKLQSTVRSEMESKAHTFEQRSVDFIRKELHAVVASEMSRLEPVLQSSTLQLMTHLSQNKAIVDTYSQAASSAAVSAMKHAFRDAVTQSLVPSVEKSLQHMFVQVNDTFVKGTSEFMRQVESSLERSRRVQDKETAAQLGSSVEKMSNVLEQFRVSIGTETKNELRKLAAEVPEKVRATMAPLIHLELQTAVRDQKMAFEGALIAVQQAAQVQRAITPAMVVPTTVDVQTQLKILIQECRFSEAFQRALSMSDLNMVLFVCQRVDAQQLFSISPCPLAQSVLLSLIQQLAADLSTSTELKLGYLQEAVMAVDFHDPVSKEHGPRIMSLLVSRLQQEVAAHPSGPLTRQLRLLLLAAQPLTHQALTH